MATYTVTINERTREGKRLATLLRSSKDVTSFRESDEYNAIKETKYLMSSPETMAAIRRGEEDLKKGDVYTQNPDESINAFLKRISCTD